MNLELSLHETRVIGCLIEKEITTPEQYPLSLNALTNACNQKSNRDPVLNLDEATVQQLIDQLSKKRLVSEQSGYGNRVPKYQHLFCNTTFGTLKLSPQELGIVCELFLRGPQTPGGIAQPRQQAVPVWRCDGSRSGACRPGPAGRWSLCSAPRARARQARITLRPPVQRRDCRCRRDGKCGGIRRFGRTHAPRWRTHGSIGTPCGCA